MDDLEEALRLFLALSEEEQLEAITLMRSWIALARSMTDAADPSAGETIE